MSAFLRAVGVAWAAALALPLFGLQEKAEERKEQPRESRTAYIRRLYERDRATFGDACRATASLLRQDHTDQEFAELLKDLASEGVVDAGWGLEEGSKLTKGTLAYMLCKALGIKGGLTMSIFGVTRRYAFRECVYVGLIAGGTVDEYVTGRELLDVFTHAGVYQEEGSLDSLRK